MGELMRLACGVRSEDLILYTDGALHGGKGELVEAHLHVCPVCRQWMADFNHTGRLIREATPPIDDPAGRAAIRALIEREALRGRRSRRPPPLLFAVAALALALLGVLLLPAQGSEARQGIGRFFQFVERGTQRSVLVGGVTPTPVSLPAPQPLSPERLAALPFTPQVPPTLPLGLRLENGEIAQGIRLGLHYRNDRGLVVLLTQIRAQDAHFTLTTSTGQLVSIGGVETVMQLAPPPGTVGVVTWEDRGTLYELSADEAPDGPLSLGEARQVVEALLAGR